VKNPWREMHAMPRAQEYPFVSQKNELVEFVVPDGRRNFRHFRVSPLNFQTITGFLQVLFEASAAINDLAVEGPQCRWICSGMIGCIMFDTKGELK
jgi:hypothetical protein